MKTPPSLRRFGYGTPVLGGLALILSCLDADSPNPTILRLGSLLSLGSLILLAIPGRRPRLRWWWIDISVCSFLRVQGLKAITRLPRPSGGPTGFPSGHTTFAFALAWLMGEAFPRAAPLWFALAVGVGWSRVETHAHFIYQVLTGAALGVFLGWRVSGCAEGVLFPRCLARCRAGKAA